MAIHKPKILYVMGVSGSGKTTIGKLLAKALNFPFFDGDDFHPRSNIDKMKSGKPLNDHDRKGWLEKLNHLAIQHKEKGAVIVCSALKQSYRDILGKHLLDKHKFVFLDGTIAEISNRLKERKNHFMPSGLLQSQFDTLEKPRQAITVSIAKTPEEIMESILKTFEKGKAPD
ncbi:gluconokinase [Maribacter sp. 2210JD10-5]|uniref:gluconokinase n=1 Tax=Maribacter sp. 2210JD10-5 TaxID=3386272 RepID=UPI0039BCE239